MIPSVRGRYRSVPMDELVTSAEELVAGGVKELILVAQETTLYGVDLYGKKCLHELLDRLNGISGLFWIRIMYCYPEEIYEELINSMIKDKKVCHYLDMPIQHCNDTILQRMGRKQIKRIDRENPLFEKTCPGYHFANLFDLRIPGGDKRAARRTDAVCQ